VHERILDGPTAPPIFGELARNGCAALALMLAAVGFTYPLAYRRRVRQLIEGARAIDSPSHASALLRRVLHAWVLRTSGQRAIFHFVSQTILRAQRHRVMLALYGGLAIALTLSNLMILRIGAGHLRIGLVAYGIRMAVPIMGFWTVIALSSIVSAPIDRRGSWLFRVVLGRPGPDHLAGARKMITLWAMLVSLTTVVILHAWSPANMRTHLVTTGQALVAIAVSLLLTDVWLFPMRTIPFTHLRTSLITDFPLMVARYFILFPLFVILVVHQERWIEASVAHLIGAALLVIAAHALLMKIHDGDLDQGAMDTLPTEGDPLFQRLGLRDS
jgi:hypothetical protein